MVDSNIVNVSMLEPDINLLGENTYSLEKDITPFHDLNLQQNCTDNNTELQLGLWLHPSVNAVRGICLIIISLLGASFNIFMIVAIVPNRRLRTVRNILLVHLGTVGLLSSVFTTLYPALTTFHGSWLGGIPMCQVYAYITCVLTSVTVWTIAALSWDKYKIIASPLHHTLTASLRKMVPFLSLLWIGGLTISLPLHFVSNEFSLNSHMGICGVLYSSTASRWYACILICLSFVFPFCLMIYCYTHIFRIARTQSGRIASTMLRMVNVIQAPITASSQNSISLRGTKAMGTILQLIGSFVLTYLPYTAIILYEVTFFAQANAIVVSIATTLFLAAPFTHAAVYGVRNEMLRSSFHRYVRRKIQRCCLKDKRRGSVKFMSRKTSTALKIPLKFAARSDEKECILGRTMSCQSKPPDIQEGAFENKATCLLYPHSCDLLESERSNGCPPARYNNNSILDDGGCFEEVGHNLREVSFCEIDDLRYMQPDLVSHACNHEMSYFSNDILKEIDCEIEMSTYENGMKERTQLDLQFQKGNSSESSQEEPSKLHPIKEIIANFELTKSKKKVKV